MTVKFLGMTTPMKNKASRRVLTVIVNGRTHQQLLRNTINVIVYSTR